MNLQKVKKFLISIRNFVFLLMGTIFYRVFLINIKILKKIIYFKRKWKILNKKYGSFILHD
jgi:hypothetical protein